VTLLRYGGSILRICQHISPPGHIDTMNAFALDKMKCQYRRPILKTVFFASSLLVFLITFRSEGQDFFAGARGGASLDTSRSRFYQAEAFAGWKIPWHWNFYSDWNLRPAVDLSAGGLTGKGEDGFVGTLGPMAELRYGAFPVVLEGGASPTWLSRYTFGSKDLGERFQFTSHIGLAWDVTRNVTVGIRFQHMSNAGLARPNPGLNMEMLLVRFNF
jgi:Lipid A 3-O-deacylase (PagL)